MKKLLPFLLISSLLISACSLKESKSLDIDAQSKCSMGAKDFFKNYSNKNKSSSYTNHYKSKDNSCYILITQDEEMPFSNKAETVHRIYNVFENQLKLECIIGSTACMDTTMLGNAIKEYME